MKKILSVFLMLCMVVTMLPGTALAEESGVSNEAELNTAITNVPEDGTIILGNDITLTATVTIASDNTKSFTLDLNGHTLDGGSKTAIKHEGTGTLAIIGSGSGGTVTAAGSGIQHTIYNAGTGVVSIEDITVSASGTDTCAIYNVSSGTVDVFSGRVSADYTAIWNDDTGVVNVHDGIVSASGTDGEAICQTAASTVNISGGIISAEKSIGINHIGTTSTTKILGGTPIIEGKEKAMSKVPDLSGYAGVQVRASTTGIGGSGATVITQTELASGISTYKYLKFEPSAAVAQIGGTGYPTLQAAVNAVEGGQIIQLLNDINLTETVTIPSTKTNNFTLDLNGKTISSNSTVLTTIQHDGSGTLTIQDSSGGGNIKNTSINGNASTIKIEIMTDGSVTLLSGTIEADMRAIDNQGSGDVIISGGKVTSAGPGGAVNSAGSGDVLVSGGIVESTDTSGTAIVRAYGGSGKIIISGTANIVAAYRCIFLNGSPSPEPVLEITGGTLTHTGTTKGYVIDVFSKNTILVSGGTLQSMQKSVIGHTYAYGTPLAAVKINIPSGGSATFKAGTKMLADDYALTLENAGVSAASENFDGTYPVSVYNPDAIGTYKYLEFGSANKVNDLDLSGKLTAPVKNGTPITDIDTAQYTGTVAWPGSPVKFLGSTIYTANVTLTAKPGYTFSGLAENSFSFAGASVTHVAGSGNILSVSVTFPTTAAKELASIAVTTPPAKMGYKYGESFIPAGMVVKATYDDGTADANYTDYTVDKTGPLGMSDTTITLTANGTSITTSFTITVTKADGPAVPSVGFSFDGVNINKLMDATASMEYSLDGGSNWADCTGNIDLTTSLGSITAANDIKVRIKETDTHHAGVIQTIDITQPLLPTGIGKTDETSERNNGTITGVSSLMEYKESGDESYTAISGSTVTGLAPGVYLVRLKAAGTALASLDATVNIAPFTKTTPTKDDLNYNLAAVNFDGTVKPVSVTAGSGKTLGAITVMYNGITTAPPINAGTYAVTVNIAGNAEYNAVTELSLGSYTINKAAYTGTTTVPASVLVSGQTGAMATLPNLPLGASYGTPTTGGAITMTAMSIAGTTLTYTAPPSTAGQTGTMTIPVTGATNYSDYTIIVTVTSTAKTPQVISYAAAAITKTYGDAPFTNPLSQTTVNGEITYASDNTSVATVNPTTGAVIIIAVGDGSATITATAAETGTHAQAAASYTVTVAPKALTLKADDKGMRKGDGLPAFTYTATGLVNGDAVTTPPAMSTTADGTAIGSFDITIKDGIVANAASYNITYTKGILTVAALPTVTSVTVPADGTYSAGSNLDFTVNFTDNVTVNTGGTPYLSLIVGSQTKQAAYVSGGGTSALLFRYTVRAGDSDPDGITIVSPLYANGGTIQDAAGNNAALTLNNVGSTNGILVNTTVLAPNFSVADVTFDSVTVGYMPNNKSIVIVNSGGAQATISDVTTDRPSVFSIHNGSSYVNAHSSIGSWSIKPAAGLAAGTHSATITVTYDDGRTATATVSITVNAVGSHTVTFHPDGGTVSETSRPVASGTAVGTLPTPTRSGGYSFDGWYTAASGGTQISASTIVSANMTCYAHWTYTGGGGGNGGGSSSNDDRSPAIVTPPAPDKPNSPTQGEIKVPGTVDGKGNVTASITDKTVTDAFDKALAEARKKGTEQNGITVVLRVDTGSKTGSHVTVNLPKAVQDTIIAKEIVNTIVVVDNPDIRVGMDLATVKEINRQANADVNITAARTDSSRLTGGARKAIGSRPVFDLKVNYGSGQAVSSFGSGSISLTIPYTLGTNEKAGNVQAVYVDSEGEIHWRLNSVYDSVEKVLRFSTDHFSTYGIGYQQVNTAFRDIAGHWAKEDIEFAVSRGLLSGTSATKFRPNTAMTRGMFATALGRLAHVDVSGSTQSSIVNGLGKGMFAPDQPITREQMAVMMSDYAQTIGYTLPKVHVENTFADQSQISTNAKEVVKQLQMAGIISGKSGNRFAPQGKATRAEVSAVLRRFVELTVSGDRLQGWRVNDSGKWMYYENGKPVTVKKEIDGTAYTFDQYGVTADVPENLGYTTYTVQEGDSFRSIARKLGCTMRELEQLNNQSRFSLIQPGDVLRVPVK
ncbi:putative glycosyl hydrolase [Desulfitobacterium sp. LBE]|nr:putative glycosyl hydrolase [Desulfitobacterium sp. LBE]